MVSGKQIAAIVIAATVAATLVPTIVDSVNTNTGSVDVTNESVTAQTGSYVDLEGYDVDAGSETVYNASGATMTAGTDYEFADANGSIKALSGGDITDGNTIEVSYTYQATTGSTTTVATLVPLFVLLLILVTLAGKVMEGL